MRRTACWITSLALLAALVGCEDKKEGMAMENSGSLSYEYPSGNYYGQDASSGGGYEDSASASTQPASAPSSSADYSSTDNYNYDSGGSNYSAPAATYASAPASSAPPAGGGGNVHTVARGETLYQLARMYYNDMSKWRVIYQANQGQLSSPHHIRVGQQLVIP